MTDRKMNGRPPLAGFLLAGVLAATAWNAPAADAERGRMLHDTRCISCHDTKIYQRETRVAKDYEGIRKEVVRWQKNVALNWNDADIDAVTTFIARAYYKVPCPVC